MNSLTSLCSFGNLAVLFGYWAKDSRLLAEKIDYVFLAEKAQVWRMVIFSLMIRQCLYRSDFLMRDKNL
jgi:hypothetical protein